MLGLLMLLGADFLQRASENWDVLMGGGTVGVAVWWVYSAFVDALPPPRPDEGRLYLFFFRFFHALAANIRKAKGQQEPTQ